MTINVLAKEHAMKIVTPLVNLRIGSAKVRIFVQQKIFFHYLFYFSLFPQLSGLPNEIILQDQYEYLLENPFRCQVIHSPAYLKCEEASFSYDDITYEFYFFKRPNQRYKNKTKLKKNYSYLLGNERVS